MKVSELIAQAQRALDQHGDIEVVLFNLDAPCMADVANHNVSLNVYRFERLRAPWYGHAPQYPNAKMDAEAFVWHKQLRISNAQTQEAQAESQAQGDPEASQATVDDRP